MICCDELWANSKKCKSNQYENILLQQKSLHFHKQALVGFIVSRGLSGDTSIGLACPLESKPQQ